MYENGEERECKWSEDKARRDKIRSSVKMKRLDNRIRSEMKEMKSS